MELLSAVDPSQANLATRASLAVISPQSGRASGSSAGSGVRFTFSAKPTPTEEFKDAGREAAMMSVKLALARTRTNGSPEALAAAETRSAEANKRFAVAQKAVVDSMRGGEVIESPSDRLADIAAAAAAAAATDPATDTDADAAPTGADPAAAPDDASTAPPSASTPGDRPA